MTPGDDFLLLTRLPTSASHSLSQQAADASAPSASAAVPTCAWPLGCDNPIEERDVCGYHADKVRDLWADFDRGEMADGH